MPLSLEEFNAQLATLGNAEATEEEKTDALLKVQESVTAFHGEFEEVTETLQKTTKQKEDLQTANTALFIKYSQHTIPPKKEESPEEKQKSFSERVTVSQLTGNSPVG